VVEYNTSTNPTFEGAVRDTSGRGNDGAMYGTAAYDVTQKALTFDGVSDTIRGTQNIGTGEKILTMAMWIKRTAAVNTYDYVCNIGTSTTGQMAGFTINSNKFNFTKYGAQTKSTTTINNGQWYHLVGVYKGGNWTTTNAEIYVDGVKETVTGGTTSVLNLTGNQITFGDSTLYDGTSDFHGSISQFKLYDTALTAEDVKTLYDMGRCDEGHHVVNFSKTRVGIGLGDGEAPRGVLEIRGNVGIGGQPTYAADGNAYPDEFPACPLHIHQASHPGIVESEGIRFSHPANIGRWNLFISDNNHFRFVYNGAAIGYVDQNDANAQMNFTGQHRTFIKNVPFSQVGELEGLIVSSDQNKYIKMNEGIETGSNAITINECLPVVSLSNVTSDKKCFGVISASEDPETRTVLYGAWGSVAEKEKGDTRVYINSVGEGAIWVTNLNGTLESGDYITTSNVVGYGQKQESEFLANYTVAKITMDCDFEPVTQPIQNIKKELQDVNYWFKMRYDPITEADFSNLIEENRRTVTETVYTNENNEISVGEYSNLESNIQSTYSELTQTLYQNITKDESKTEQEGYELEVRQELVNVLDEHGQIQWEDHPIETEKAYKIRYLDANGVITDEASAVHTAAFVGCTYHCG
jgi:hypothetical protein